jgi:hypothetical protein
MARKVAKRDNARAVSMRFHCGNIDREVEVAVDGGLEFSGYEAECDMCGSHGDVSVEFACECGFRHSISLSSW